MSTRPVYHKGTFNVICDICGRQYKSYELQKRWDGFMVCKDDFEPRQPQDFVRGVADFQAPPYTRPENADVFVGVCTPDGMSCIVDYAVADCCVTDYIALWFDFNVNPPSCDITYYATPYTVPGNTTDWACNTLMLDAALTIDGIYGVQQFTLTVEDS